jgi:RHS repeat-associated protein
MYPIPLVNTLHRANLRSQHNDPYLMRWGQPDTVIPGEANPQAWNRYSYVFGNPFQYIDPSGHAPICDEEGNCYDRGRGSYRGIRSDAAPDSIHVHWQPKSTDIKVCLASDYQSDFSGSSGSENFNSTNPTTLSNSSASQGITWEDARNFFGALDPIELGPLSGTNLNILQGVQEALGGYVVACGYYCLENPWIGKLVLSVFPVGSAVAITYDIAYDQITETGPYSTLPLDPDKWTPKQKFYVIAVVVTIVVGAPP